MKHKGWWQRGWVVSSLTAATSGALAFGVMLGWGVAAGGEPAGGAGAADTAPTSATQAHAAGSQAHAAANQAADESRLFLPAVLHGTAQMTSDFTLTILPERITNSVPGQRCVYLLTLDEGEDGGSGPVALSVASDAGQVALRRPAISAGEVAEVVLVPDADSQEKTISLEVRGTRASVTDTVTAALDVLIDWPGVDEERGAYAADVRDRFVPWLAQHHPELGIDQDTTWEGTIVTPQILVVMHYLFFSDEWEMHVAWHVMIPPHDWARIDLRRRADETVPSRAFEISSWGDATEPIEIEPPEEIWR